MAGIRLKKKYRIGNNYKNQNSTKSISGSSSKKNKKLSKRHANQKDMVLVVRPGFRKMMTVDDFKAFERNET